MPADTPNTSLTAMIVEEVKSVVASTIRYPNVVRETLYQARVQPLFGKLTTSEIMNLHHECGFAHGIGWAVLSQALGIMSGQDESRKMGKISPTPLYTPKHNYGGWVRIFRLKAAALPLTMLDFVTDREWSRIVPEDPESEAEARGTWGISPYVPLTREVLKEALEASDLFTAPWMVAIWRPEHGWVVKGAASRYRENPRVFGLEHPETVELFSRPFADQVRPSTFDSTIGAYTFTDDKGAVRNVTNPGPDLGIREVIPAIEMALRLGYRLDLVSAPNPTPMDTWRDAVEAFSETPLMGVLLQMPSLALLPSFQMVAATKEFRIEGIDPRDYPVFHEGTKINPERPIQPQDIESLVMLGVPVFGRIPSFFAFRQGEEPKA